MLTKLQIRNGVVRFMEEEILPKVAGKRHGPKVSALELAEDMIGRHGLGALPDDMLVSVSEVFPRVFDIESSGGSIIECFPKLGDVAFFRNDIEKLMQCICQQSDTNKVTA